MVRLKELRFTIIYSLVFAALYILMNIAVTKAFEPDYSGNELSLEAIETLIKVNAGIYDY